MSKQEVKHAETGNLEPSVHARDLFKAKKADQGAPITRKLPKSGVDVTYPGFISHNESMAVMAAAGVTSSKAKKSEEGKRKLVAYAASKFCTFGPNKDRLSAVEIGELLSNEDTSFLAPRLLGSDDDEEDDAEPGKD
jgi:hypothetical protein